MEGLSNVNPVTVQGTNDSSIVSKASMSHMGYFGDPFVSLFIQKMKRRSPLINRGYYIRQRAIDHFITGFLQSVCRGGKETQIVSLGAGFDATYFRLKSEGLLNHSVFFEIDYPEVVNRKTKLIMNTVALITFLKSCKMLPIGLDSIDYRLVGCDLCDLHKLETDLCNRCIKFDVPTFFLSECVMTYMEPEKSYMIFCCPMDKTSENAVVVDLIADIALNIFRSSALVEWVSSKFQNAIFVCYEQIYPDDAFGQVMQKHFIKLQSPLRAIRKYPTLAHQTERYKKRGWDFTKALDMNHFYLNYVSKEEKAKIDNLEPFDEFEEWHLKCSHYAIVVAAKGSLRQSVETLLHTKQSLISGNQSSILPSSSFKLITLENEGIQRFGHCCTSIGAADVLVCGGTGVYNGKHIRLRNCFTLKLPTGWPVDPDGISFSTVSDVLPEPRLFASLSTLNDTKCLVFGGRKSPVQAFASPIMLEVDRLQKQSDRFSSVKLLQDVLFTNDDKDRGDGNNEVVHSDDVDHFMQHSERLTNATTPSARWRHASSFLTDKNDSSRKLLFLCGGRMEDSLALNDSWLFDSEKFKWHEINVDVKGRHSHTASHWDGEVVIFGGLDAESRALNDITIIGLKGNELTSRNLVFSPPLPPRYSHTAHVVNSKLVVIGGVDPGDCLRSDILVVDMLRLSWRGFSFPVETFTKPFMLHNHVSVVRDNGIFVVIGGGGNCFSFGTHFNDQLLYVNLRNVLMDNFDHS